MISIAYLRQFRIGEYAIFDFAIAFIGVFLLSPLLSKIFLKLGVRVPKYNWLYLTLPIGIVFHIAFGRITPMTENLLNPNGHYLLKIVILGLFILGLKGIKIVRKK